MVRKLGNRIEGCKKSVLLCTIAWISTRAEWLAGSSAVRKVSCSFAVYYIRSNGKDAGSRLRITICMILFDLLHKHFEHPYSDIVCSVVIISVSWEISLCNEVYYSFHICNVKLFHICIYYFNIFILIFLHFHSYILICFYICTYIEK